MGMLDVCIVGTASVSFKFCVVFMNRESNGLWILYVDKTKFGLGVSALFS